jgi:hypothetical protein
VADSVTFHPINTQSGGKECGDRFLVMAAIAANCVITGKEPIRRRLDSLVSFKVQGGGRLRAWTNTLLKGDMTLLPVEQLSQTVGDGEIIDLHQSVRIRTKPDTSCNAEIIATNTQLLEHQTYLHLKQFKACTKYIIAATALQGSSLQEDSPPVPQLVKRLQSMASDKGYKEGWSGGHLELQLVVDAMRKKWNVDVYIEVMGVKQTFYKDAKTCEVKQLMVVQPTYENELYKNQIADASFLTTAYSAVKYKLVLLHYCGSKESEDNGNPPGHYGILWAASRTDKDKKKYHLKEGSRRRSMILEEVPDNNHCWSQCVATWASALDILR